MYAMECRNRWYGPRLKGIAWNKCQRNRYLTVVNVIVIVVVAECFAEYLWYFFLIR